LAASRKDTKSENNMLVAIMDFMALV